MNKKLLWIVLLIGVLLIPTAAALAKELGAMDISGPGIDGTMRIDDLDDLGQVLQGGFFDQSSRISALSDDEVAALGEGYHITFYIMGGEEGVFVYRETATYYPDPEGGQGYMHWTGGGEANVDIVPSSTWTRVRSGEQAFWTMMEKHGVTRPEANEAAPIKANVAEAIDEPANNDGQPAAEAPSINAADAAEASTASEPAAQPASPGWVIAVVVALILIAVGAGIVLRQRGKHEESLAASD